VETRRCATYQTEAFRSDLIQPQALLTIKGTNHYKDNPPGISLFENGASTLFGKSVARRSRISGKTTLILSKYLQRNIPCFFGGLGVAFVLEQRKSADELVVSARLDSTSSIKPRSAAT